MHLTQVQKLLELNIFIDNKKQIHILELNDKYILVDVFSVLVGMRILRLLLMSIILSAMPG